MKINAGSNNQQSGSTSLGGMNQGMNQSTSTFEKPVSAFQKAPSGGLAFTKGDTLSLKKIAPSLQNCKVGLGWDVAKMGQSFDLDAHAFLLDKNGRLVSNEHFVYFSNLRSPDGSVIHKGDNLTGEGDGDDEVIDVMLNNVSPEVEKVVVTVSIYQAKSKGQSFGDVQRAFIRLCDSNTNQELIMYDLSGNYAGFTSLILGELERGTEGWKFNAIGEGVNGELETLAARFGYNK